MDAAGPPPHGSQHHHDSSSHHHNIYPPPPLPPSISRGPSTMYTPTAVSFYNSEPHYRAPLHHQPPQHLLPASIGQDHLLSGGSAHSYDHQDGLAYGQHQQNPRWPNGIYSDQHNSSSHAPNGHHPAGLPMMGSHSQGPSPTYHQISPAAQPVNPLMYNDLLQMQQPQSGYLAPQQDPYTPRTTAGWEMRVAATAGSHTLSPLTALDGQSSISTSPTSHTTPLVGRQGTRGILPSAPGREDPTTEEEIEPIQDPQTKKWQCPACPATFSFPKHVKRHYMRHTGERPYECLCCRTCFARSDVLKRHYEKCAERTPGWREIPVEERADHLQGRRGRPKRTTQKKQQNRRRQGRTPGASGASGPNSRQSSRRSSRDGQDGPSDFSNLTMTAGRIS